MKLTTDDSTLITCSVDGSICVWKVRDADQEKSTTFPDDVIISRREFKRKLETVTALESRLDQLTVQIVIDTAELSKTYGKRIQDLDEMRSSIMERDERHLQVSQPKRVPLGRAFNRPTPYTSHEGRVVYCHPCLRSGFVSSESWKIREDLNVRKKTKKKKVRIWLENDFWKNNTQIIKAKYEKIISW